MRLTAITGRQDGSAPDVDGPRKPVLFAGLSGGLLVGLGVLACLALLAFLLALVTSGAFALWGIEILLRLAGA